ncbi:MAG: hypothetical protein PVF70_09875 [Anaerolineales bacterium]
MSNRRLMRMLTWILVAAIVVVALFHNFEYAGGVAGRGPGTEMVTAAGGGSVVGRSCLSHPFRSLGVTKGAMVGKLCFTAVPALFSWLLAFQALKMWRTTDRAFVHLQRSGVLAGGTGISVYLHRNLHLILVRGDAHCGGLPEQTAG